MEFCFWEPFILGSGSGKGAGELRHGWPVAIWQMALFGVKI